MPRPIFPYKQQQSGCLLSYSVITAGPVTKLFALGEGGSGVGPVKRNLVLRHRARLFALAPGGPLVVAGARPERERERFIDNQIDD